MLTQKIIALVESQPPIWNKNSDEYKDKFEKEKAWKAVARGVYANWDSFPKKEQNQKMISVKKKWKNIRDCLKKFLMHTNTKRKKYVHFEALSFLLGADDMKRLSDGDFEYDGSSQDEDCDSSSLMHNDVDEPQQTLPEMTTSCSATANEQNSCTNSSQRALAQCPVHTSIMKIIDQASSTFAVSSRTHEDADRLYLLSLLPDFKNLDTGKKWEFRRYVADFFQDACKT